ncbi:Mth938-like domain-containing protein [Sphingosinithalassobacter portus]|uniref:Mth938-like domain-containing protein n=1 Tax=Stakelama portus TaxID=2676234 RepID=UPI000D6E0622|nr:Mth938-like domain-containing protein [Sphingosinithalassobacter portus]
MRMDRMGAEGPVISGFSGGGFVVDGGAYRALVLTPVRADSWTPPSIDALGEGDVAPLLALDPQPEFLLLGTGASLVRPPAAFTQALTARGIGVEVMDSRAAARAWGMLRAEQRWIAGALYPLD